jgi:hypothetical protein
MSKNSRSHSCTLSVPSVLYYDQRIDSVVSVDVPDSVFNLSGIYFRIAAGSCFDHKRKNDALVIRTEGICADHFEIIAHLNRAIKTTALQKIQYFLNQTIH